MEFVGEGLFLGLLLKKALKLSFKEDLQPIQVDPNIKLSLNQPKLQAKGTSEIPKSNWHYHIANRRSAAEQVANAINGFNKLPPHQLPDLLIVARGGGSLEDLWTFNEENVVRSAANSQIPIISAIGHETDTTLIDYASDLRAPTPTAAAELATPVLSQILYTLES
eukprot:gene16046-16215_t